MIRIEGDLYEKFSRSIYINKGSSDLSKLNKWKQPFYFFGDSDLLVQDMAGPCGALATIQAQILFYRSQQEYSNVNVNREHLLILSLLDIMQRIGQHYVFCTSFNPKAKIAEFIQKDTQEEAIQYIKESNFLSNPQSVLLYLLSIVFLANKMTKMQTIGVPLLGADQFTEMTLVWIMLLGTLNEDMISQMESGNESMLPQHEISLRVIHNSTQVNGTHFNRNANIFVVHNIDHFIAVSKFPNFAIVYDTLNYKKGPHPVSLNSIFD